ncbi:hypothetical protein F5Y16DRAFT_68363 [Xylariaceae sp. FL0255]|nr:hypothetical protein F5Y16DRAFT_68363 [Xylariaceae sp. FL0255]
MVKFIESDQDGFPRKRKQVAQACERCRQRKKRCIHTETTGVVTESPSPSRLSLKATGRPPSSSGHRPSSQQHETSLTPTTQGVALSSGNGTQQPEDHPPSMFVGDMSPGSVLMEATNLCSHRDTSTQGGIGTWQAQLASQSNRVPGILSVQPTSRKVTQDMLASYLWNHYLPFTPPGEDFAALKRIYLDKLDPLIPFFGPECLRNPPNKVTEILLKQVVSLAAAADPEAAQHLRLTSGGPLLSRQEFCAFLSNSVLTALDAGLVTDRIWVTRFSVALAFYSQPLTPEDADVPSLLNSRAIHQMHTLGLHMGAGSDKKIEATRTLFCTLWAVDRIISAFYGRACLIHERDVGLDIEDCIQRQAPAFRLLLTVVVQLEKVIALYRPGTRMERPTFVDMPIFEQMIYDAEALRIPSNCLASLEVFYHSVAILSSQSPADGTTSTLPNPATNSRRSLSADRITQIVGCEFRGQLAYTPIIPYGVSLSLNVSYRKMRHSKVPMFRSRGKQSFRTNTALLKSMDDMFWTARTMVAMAEQVLEEMGKAVASLAQENGLTDSSKKGDQPSSAESSQPPLQTHDIRTAENTGMGSLFDGDNTNWLLLDSVLDLDVFGYFDPTFDLGAVDAALQGNLDFGVSSNWFDWQQQSWVP